MEVRIWHAKFVRTKSTTRLFALVTGFFLLTLTSLLWIYQARAAACTETVTNGTQSVSGTNYTSRVISFTGADCTDTFDIPERATVEILAVGGGGGGGGGSSTTNSGGGGGGGYVYIGSVTLTDSVTVTINVGAGEYLAAQLPRAETAKLQP